MYKFQANKQKRETTKLRLSLFFQVKSGDFLEKNFRRKLQRARSADAVELVKPGC